MIALWLLAAGTLAAADASTNTFPQVTGRNLLGKDVSFPDAFAGAKHNVVIIAFTRKQQPLVDTWLPELASLSATNKDVKYLELPTIKKMNRLLRWTIYKGMRSDIQDAGARSRTVTLHIDKGPFKAQLGVKTEEDIYIYLLDERGRVKWQAKGTFSEAKMLALKQNLSLSQS